MCCSQFTIEDAGDGRLVTVMLTKSQKTTSNTHWPAVIPGEATIVRAHASVHVGLTPNLHAC